MTTAGDLPQRLARTLLAVAADSGPEFALLQDPASGACVQFVAGNSGQLIFEAVSNEFLPDNAQLAPAQIDWLRARGFSEPDPSHQREITLQAAPNAGRAQLTQVARDAIEVLRDLYVLPSDTLEMQTDD